MQEETFAQRIVLTLATLSAVTLCSIHAAVAGQNTVPAAGIGYLTLTLVMFGCSWAFWTRARSAEGALFIRWSMVSAGALAAAIGYAPAWMQALLHTPPARQFPTACFNASEGLFILAAVLFFAGVPRSIVLVDMLQALLFMVLRFNLIYSPTAYEHFTRNHLLIGQIVALSLLLIAVVACFGAVSEGELTFLRTLSWFFGLRLVAFFLSNQVCYTWLHNNNCGLWDVPGPALLAGFALYLLYKRDSTRDEENQTAELRNPSITVRTLMPSFLALINLLLGLFVLRISIPMAAWLISASLVCYVARTFLMHAQSMKEKTQLETRNQQLEGLAISDPLTGIGNRRSLAGVYSQLHAATNRQKLSLLLIDIDHFKQANDRHGHLHGDRVLVTLAETLESLAAGVPGSHCSRFGGDEFAVLLVGIPPEEASALAETLRSRFSSHAFEAESGRTSLSIGVASLQLSGDLPLETLISLADKALYRAKLLGRNRVEAQPLWEPPNTEPIRRLQLQPRPR
jgi:diguanylate cyclase (GGDEF)-like protein